MCLPMWCPPSRIADPHIPLPQSTPASVNGSHDSAVILNIGNNKIIKANVAGEIESKNVVIPVAAISFAENSLGGLFLVRISFTPNAANNNPVHTRMMGPYALSCSSNNAMPNRTKTAEHTSATAMMMTDDNPVFHPCVVVRSRQNNPTGPTGIDTTNPTTIPFKNVISMIIDFSA